MNNPATKSLKIESSLHKRVKTHASAQGVRIQDVVGEALGEWADWMDKMEKERRGLQGFGNGNGGGRIAGRNTSSKSNQKRKR